MANRDIARNRQSTRQTTSSTTFGDALALTFTPANGNREYVIFFAGLADKSTTGTDTNVRLRNDTASATLVNLNIEPHDTTDLTPVFGMAFWTSPSTPVSQTFSVEHATETTGTVGLDDISIVAFELHSLDQKVETTASTSTTSASYQTAQTLTFTPPTDGEYLIFAFAEYTAGNVPGIRVSIDASVVYFTTATDSSDASSQTPWMGVYRTNLTASSHTILLEYVSDGINSAALRNRRIFALRLDTIRRVASDFNAARTTSTSTTPVTAASVATTAEGSVVYHIFGNHALDVSSTSLSVISSLSLDGTIWQSSLREYNASGNRRSWFAMDYQTYTAGSRTSSTRFNSESTNTSGAEYRGVYVLDLRENHVLTIGDTAHSHTAEEPAVGDPRVIGDGAAHALTSDAPTFTQVHSVTVSDAAHSHFSEDIRLRFPKHYYNELLTETTFTNTSYDTHLSLTFTPEITSNFLVMYACDVRVQDTQSSPGWANTRLTDGVVTSDPVGNNPRDVLNFTTQYGLLEVQGFAGVSKTVTLQRQAIDVSTSGWRIRNARIIAMEKPAGANSTVSASYSSSSPTEVGTITVPEDGDYLLLAMGGAAMGASGGSVSTIQFWFTLPGPVDVVKSNTAAGVRIDDGGAYRQFAVMYRGSFTAGDVIDLMADAGSASPSLVRGNVFLMQLSDFAAYNDSYDNTEHTRTSSTYSDVLELSYTGSRQYSVVLYNAYTRSSTSDIDVLARHYADGTVVHDQNQENYLASGLTYQCFFGLARVEYDRVGARSYKTAFASEDDVTAVYIDDTTIIALSFGDLVPHIVALQDAAHSHTAEQSTISQVHSVTLADANHGHTADNITLVSIQIVSPNDGAHSHTADNVALTQVHSLVAGSAEHGHTVDNVIISQVHSLTLAQTEHGHTADSVSLSQVHSVTLQSTEHGHAADNAHVSVLYSVDLQSAEHGHTADQVITSQVHILSNADGSHGHSADNIVLSQVHYLTAGDATHGHSADNVVLTQVHTVVLQSAEHSHSAENVSVSQAHLLALQGADHGHTADALSLSQVHSLGVLSADHVHTADNVVLAQVHLLFTVSAEHDHTADSITLSQVHIVPLDSAEHDHTADNVDFEQVHSVAVASAEHDHTADNIAISQVHTVTVSSAEHGQTAFDIIIEQVHSVGVDSTEHVHTADAVDIRIIIVYPTNAQHGMSSDEPELDNFALLLVNRSLHDMFSDNVLIKFIYPVPRDYLALDVASDIFVADAPHGDVYILDTGGDIYIDIEEGE